jgi:hypothetical protein
MENLPNYFGLLFNKVIWGCFSTFFQKKPQDFGLSVLLKQPTLSITSEKTLVLQYYKILNYFLGSWIQRAFSYT